MSFNGGDGFLKVIFDSICGEAWEQLNMNVFNFLEPYLSKRVTGSGMIPVDDFSTILYPAVAQERQEIDVDSRSSLLAVGSILSSTLSPSRILK